MTGRGKPRTKGNGPKGNDQKGNDPKGNGPKGNDPKGKDPKASNASSQQPSSSQQYRDAPLPVNAWGPKPGDPKPGEPKTSRNQQYKEAPASVNPWGQPQAPLNPNSAWGPKSNVPPTVSTGGGGSQQAPNTVWGKAQQVQPSGAPTTAWGKQQPVQQAGPQESQQAGARGSQQAGLQGSQQAGAQGSQQAGARGSQQAGPQRSQQAGLQRSQQEGPQGSQQAGQQRGQPSSKQESSRGQGGKSDSGAEPEKRVIKDIIRTKPAYIQSKCGALGTRVPLLTNYYKLLKKPTWQCYQYRVDFSPEIVNAGFRQKLIHEQKSSFEGYLFDGQSMLFLTVKLQNQTTEFMSKDRDDNPIQTTVRFVGLISMSTAQSIQILNLIQRKSMKGMNLQLVGRNYFDKEERVRIPAWNLEIWPGYITSIRQHEVDILLCAEITNKVMRNESLLDILNDCYNRNRQDFLRLFKEQVIGMIVLTDYNNKTYRIDDVDFEKTPLSTFDGKNGPTTFVEYYKSKYDITIRDKKQPLLISKAKDRAIRGGESKLLALVPELCRPTGLTDAMRSNYSLTRGLAQYMRPRPADRINKLKAFNQRLQQVETSAENFKEWDFQLDSNLVEVTGRVLKNDTITFGNNKRVTTNAEADWSREFRNTTMFNSQHLKEWAIIYSNQYQRDVEAFMGLLQRSAQGMNFQLGNPRRITIANDNSATYASALDQAANGNPQLIMCIVGNQLADRYSLIKKKCCVSRAIPSQVMVIRTIVPKRGKDLNSLMTVATKVVIQLNSKLGGAPWMVDVPLEKLMVVGFDVCHDTTNKKQSYGALVATMDMQNKQNYFSTISAHANGIDLCKEFGLNIQKAVTAYRNQHGYLPDKILIYRDGVGEGQTDYVYQTEVKDIQAALKQTYGNIPFKMTFIVVSKRINTRFFKDPRNPTNPSPGTIVDDVVTLPERYDFFLVSQNVNQGTVTPTNYNVLHDDMKLPIDRLQTLTYRWTHMYYNWTGTLRVPAVCQYAHKLAFLVGNFIHEAPSAGLEKKLYFL